MAFDEWNDRVVAQGASLALTSNGTTLVDGFANAHAATLHGGPVVTPSYAQIDGLGQYISFGAHADFATADPMTFEAYIMVEKTSPAVSGVGGWFWKYNTDGDSGIQAFISNQGTDNNKLWSITVRVGGTSYSVNSASGSITFGVPFYLVATLSAGVITSYINAANPVTGSTGGGLNQLNDATIGRGFIANRLFRGRIYTLANTKGLAIDASEVTARYKLLNPAAIGAKGKVAASKVVIR
jgi:hypothetical protein